jgi:hypothetical protein
MVVASLPADLKPGVYCNDGDALVAARLGTSAKVLWHVRHGESEGNVAKHNAQAMDKTTSSGNAHFEAYVRISRPLSSRCMVFNVNLFATCRVLRMRNKTGPNLSAGFLSRVQPLLSVAAVDCPQLLAH